MADKYDVDVISMLAPTSENRIKTIAKDAQGFIYLVSSMGVTGVRSEIKTDLKSIVAAVSDGAIVGSAIVKLIAQYGEGAAPYIYDYVKSMKEGVLRA